MKTRHAFHAGDLIRHSERTGYIVHREIIGNRDTVIVQWDDGARQTGLHSRLWMCERADNFPTGGN
jgi:hypothetical protein